MQPRDIKIHSATPGTSFQTLTGALALIFQEQGLRISPALWSGEGARQICLVPFPDHVAFEMEHDGPADIMPLGSGFITQSWDDLMAEVEAELTAVEGPVQEQYGLAEQGTAGNTDVDPVVLPLRQVSQEPSVGIVFVITEERLGRQVSGGYAMVWALSAVHNERWYRVLARESVSGELLELQDCGLNVLGAVGRLQREGLLERGV